MLDFKQTKKQTTQLKTLPLPIPKLCGNYKNQGTQQIILILTCQITIITTVIAVLVQRTVRPFRDI